jgi:replicative DNA helicase
MDRPRQDRDPPTLPPTRPGEIPPPHAPEAESGLLGAILVDQTAMVVALEHLRPEDFFHPANQKVMESMVRLFETGTGIDSVTVINALRVAGDLDAIGGPTRILQLVTEAASPAGAEFYAKIIRDKSIVRRMIATASRIVSDGYQEGLDPQEFLDKSERALFAVGEARLRGTIHSLSRVMEEAVQRIESLRERGEHVTGIPTGFNELDSKLLGFQNSDLVIIAARPSMGKTAVALNLALNAARDAGRHVLFCSLEMSEAQLATRLIAMHKNLPSSKLRSGSFLYESDMDAIREAADTLSGIPMYIDDAPKLSVLELRARARRMKFDHRLDLVMVDYLQLMDPTDKRVSREQQISEISRSLKALAKELDIPVIALAQLSRAPETRPGKDKRPILSDLRESGAIEQDADVVMFLYRQEYYDRDQTKEEDRGVLEVIVAKQRNGPTGIAKLAFLSESGLVANRVV